MIGEPENKELQKIKKARDNDLIGGAIFIIIGFIALVIIWLTNNNSDYVIVALIMMGIGAYLTSSYRERGIVITIMGGLVFIGGVLLYMWLNSLAGQIGLSLSSDYKKLYILSIAMLIFGFIFVVIGIAIATSRKAKLDEIAETRKNNEDKTLVSKRWETSIRVPIDRAYSFVKNWDLTSIGLIGPRILVKARVNQEIIENYGRLKCVGCQSFMSCDSRWCKHSYTFEMAGDFTKIIVILENPSSDKDFDQAIDKIAGLFSKLETEYYNRQT